MFSESKASGRGEQRGFKHMPHFFPWLCSGLKTHQTGGGGDLGLRGAFRRSPADPRLEVLAPQGRIKEEIQGRDKEKHRKSVPRGTGMGLARRLPLVLRGRHILSEGLGKAKDGGPGKKDPSPEPVPNPDSGTRPAVQDGPARDPGSNGVPVKDFNSEPSPVRTPGSQLSLPSTPQSEGVGPPLRKYGPLAPIPVPVPTPPGKQAVQEAPDPAVPSPRSTEEEDRERLSVFLRRTYRQRDPTFSCWINSPTWSTIDRQRGFKSNVGGPQERSTGSPGQRPPAGRDELPGARFNHRGSFKGDVLSRERPHTETGFTRTLPGRRKPRPKSELVQSRGPEQVLVQPRATGAVDSTGAAAAAAAANEPGHLGPRCHRKAVRSQIKRVVVNLEQVVGALKNVQQEMKEVVEQIDYLTSVIDLNAQEEEGKMEVGKGGGGGGRGDVPRPPSNSGSGSTSATSGVTVGSLHPPKLSEQEEEEEEKAEETGCTPMSTSTLKRGHHPRNHTARPTACAQTTVRRLPEKTPAPHNARTTGSSQKRGAPPSYGHLALHASSPINRAVQSHPLPQRPASQRPAPSPHRSSSPSPARPPTPGLSPLPVGPVSATSSSSPGPPSPLATPPRAFPPPGALPLSLPHSSPVATYPLSGSCESPLSRHPSASPASLSPSPSPARPPAPSGPLELSETLPARTDGEREESQAGSGDRTHPAPRESATLPERIRNPAAQGRRGRRPPPYPHARLFERGRRAKDPRQAPPYPEKRRLLSTTV